MDDDDHYSKQYKRIAAADDLIQEGALMQDYIALYKKKYRGEPLVDVNRVQIAQIRHLKTLAKDKAHALLHHYFTMSDSWFIQQAYSLDCLIKNLHKVHADFSKKATVHRDSGKIARQFLCEACEKEFTLATDLHADISKKLVRCEACEKENRPMKTYTRAERHAAILKIGSAFPEMPCGIDSTEETKY
jgi:hypothetical protein